MKRLFAGITKRKSDMLQKMDGYQEAITFAEAGYPEMAMDSLKKPEAEKSVRAKLLVVGREGMFSNDIIQYALDMAKRMSYDILALNAAPLSCTNASLFSSSRREACREFERLAEENAARFQKAAAESGVEFSHVIKFRETDHAIEELIKEQENINFVVTEPEEHSVAVMNEDREYPAQEIRKEMFVYTMS